MRIQLSFEKRSSFFAFGFLSVEAAFCFALAGESRGTLSVVEDGDGRCCDASLVNDSGVDVPAVVST